MSRVYGTLDAAAIRRRAEALERFSRWQAGLRPSLSPSAAIAAVAMVYDLLPPASRQRPVDASGVVRLHRDLAALPRREA